MSIEGVQKAFQWIRSNPRLAIPGIALAILVACVGLFLGGYLTQIGTDFGRDRGRTLSIAQVTVGTTSEHSSIDIVFDNDALSDAVIRGIDLQGEYDGGLSCCCPPVETFHIASVMRISSSDRSGILGGTFSTETGGDVQYRLTGSIIDSNCESRRINLSLVSPVQIPKEATTRVRVMIPKAVSVVGYEISSEEDKVSFGGPETYELNLDDFQTWRIRARPAGGAEITWSPER